MFQLKRTGYLPKDKQKRLLAFLFTRRHIAGAVAIGDAVILILSNVAPRLFNNWQRPSDRVTPTDTGHALSLDAIVIEPKTSAIQLAPLSGDPKARSPDSSFLQVNSQKAEGLGNISAMRRRYPVRTRG